MTVYVSFSGGLDSTALLTRYARRDERVVAVSFDYGQRHDRELQAAQEVAQTLGVERRTVNLQGLMSGSSLLYDGEVPDGHYAAHSMASTVVNGRNLLFASALVAQASEGDVIALGVHSGDHHVYADCRPEFIDGLRQVAAAYGVVVAAPWVRLSKTQIIEAEPDAPFALTWSCYKGGTHHCGTCGTCVERAEAFALAGHPDPTTYDLTGGTPA